MCLSFILNAFVFVGYYHIGGNCSTPESKDCRERMKTVSLYTVPSLLGKIMDQVTCRGNWNPSTVKQEIILRPGCSFNPPFLKHTVLEKLSWDLCRSCLSGHARRLTSHEVKLPLLLIPTYVSYSASWPQLSGRGRGDFPASTGRAGAFRKPLSTIMLLVVFEFAVSFERHLKQDGRFTWRPPRSLKIALGIQSTTQVHKAACSWSRLSTTWETRLRALLEWFHM